MLIREYTLEEALKLAAQPRDNSGLNCSSRDGSNDDWGGGSFSKALDLATNGYKAGAARLNERLRTMPPRIREAQRPRPVWGPSGSSVDLGRFVAGEPDNMISVVRARRASPVLRIGIERAVSSITSTETIEATGASVLAVVERLRAAGVQSEIWATFTQSVSPIATSQIPAQGDDVMQIRVLIQQAGRPIDMDRLAFWVMHPAALRRIAFAIEETEPVEIRKHFGFDHGYGYCPMGKAYNDGSFDEVAPGDATQATAWIEEVFDRRH